VIEAVACALPPVALSIPNMVRICVPGSSRPAGRVTVLESVAPGWSVAENVCCAVTMRVFGAQARRRYLVRGRPVTDTGV
jgi:hypothetical protein